MIVAYDGGFFSDVSGVSRSNGLMTARNHVGGYLRVERGRIEPGMSEQNLDQTHIGFLFEQVGGKAVAQCVRRHSLLDRRPIGSGMNDAIELPRRQRQQRITAREQPERGPGDAIPIAQQLQQPRGKHCKAILAPLALLDAQQHARSESMSDTFSATTSETRNPAP